MYNNKLTELDKIECAEYVLDLISKKLTSERYTGSEHDWDTDAWVQRCKDECIIRRGQYLYSKEGRQG